MKKVRWLARDLIVGPYLALCLDEETFRKVMRKVDPDESPGPFMGSDAADATTHYWRKRADGKLIAVVTMRPKPDVSMVVAAGLLVHEAVHVFDSFCEQIQERNPSSEFRAYSIQAIAQRLLQSFEEQTTQPKARSRARVSRRAKSR